MQKTFALRPTTEEIFKRLNPLWATKTSIYIILYIIYYIIQQSHSRFFLSWIKMENWLLTWPTWTWTMLSQLHLLVESSVHTDNIQSGGLTQQACRFSPAALAPQLCPPRSPHPAHRRSTPSRRPPSCAGGRSSRARDAPVQRAVKEKQTNKQTLIETRAMLHDRLHIMYPSMQQAGTGTQCCLFRPFWTALLLLDLYEEAAPASTRCSVTERQTFISRSRTVLTETYSLVFQQWCRAHLGFCEEFVLQQLSSSWPE